MRIVVQSVSIERFQGWSRAGQGPVKWEPESSSACPLRMMRPATVRVLSASTPGKVGDRNSSPSGRLTRWGGMAAQPRGRSNPDRGASRSRGDETATVAALTQLNPAMADGNVFTSSMEATESSLHRHRGSCKVPAARSTVVAFR